MLMRAPNIEAITSVRLVSWGPHTLYERGTDFEKTHDKDARSVSNSLDRLQRLTLRRINP